MNHALKHLRNEARPEPSAAGRDSSPTGARLRHGDVEVDCAERRATVAGRALDLTDGEFALLLHFVNRPNRLVTRSELLAKVWSMPSHTGSNVVDVVVCRLRRRLGSHGHIIETVRGLGYRFRAPDRASPVSGTWSR